MMIVTREDIATVLQLWQAGEVAAAQVHEWAQARYGQVEFDDWEDDDTNSVANEVFGTLDMLDMNLMLIEDVPIYLAFLRTPPGQFGEGYRAFQDALQRIDYQARKQALHTHPLYARFCE
jgi:hypothetical protein